MKSTDVRKLWTQFRESQEHARSDPASLIVNNADDPTTMFNTAGMQPLVPYLMGKEHPTGSKRVYNIQWCVRTVDIDDVWDRSHLTYFEMMWNWSLGDYFKKESIAWSWEFLTQYLKLDSKKLCVTVFEWDENSPRDEESAQLRREQWVPNDKIAYLNKKENRRWPAWATWPCGPDTEIFYRVGEWEFPPEGNHTWNDEDNWMEIWNNVFMAYYLDEKGFYSDLPAPNVDTWMWFERICMVLQHASWAITKPLKEASVYDTDIFKPIMDLLAWDSPVESKRIIADHARTAAKLVQWWLIPSNEWRGYVLRRIIRRMYFQWTLHFSTMEAFENFINQVKNILNILYSWEFTDQTIKTILDECKQFAKTISSWEKMVQEMIAWKSGDWVLDGDSVFKLYDTYGFPVELTEEIVVKAWWSVDKDGFEKAMKEAQERSRSWSQQKFAKGTDRASVIDGIPQTDFVWYTDLEVDNVKLLKDIVVGEQRMLITDRTSFYAESWWQKWDKWTIEMDDWSTVQVTDVIKYWGVFIHMVK